MGFALSLKSAPLMLAHSQLTDSSIPPAWSQSSTDKLIWLYTRMSQALGRVCTTHALVQHLMAWD